MHDITIVAAESFVLVMACAILIVDVFASDRAHRIAYWMAQSTLVGALLLVTVTYTQAPVLAFHGTVVNDAMGGVLKSVILTLVIFVFIYARDYLSVRERMTGEFFVLGLFAVLGMMVLTSAHSMLTLYLGLEAAVAVAVLVGRDGS